MNLARSAILPPTKRVGEAATPFRHAGRARRRERAGSSGKNGARIIEFDTAKQQRWEPSQQRPHHESPPMLLASLRDTCLSLTTLRPSRYIFSMLHTHGLVSLPGRATSALMRTAPLWQAA